MRQVRITDTTSSETLEAGRFTRRSPKQYFYFCTREMAVAREETEDQFKYISIGLAGKHLLLTAALRAPAAARHDGYYQYIDLSLATTHHY